MIEDKLFLLMGPGGESRVYHPDGRSCGPAVTTNRSTKMKTTNRRIEKLRRELEELKEAAGPALNEYRAEKTQLVSALADNERCPFEKEELESKSLEELRKLDSMATQRDYSGRGGPRKRTATEVDLGWEPEPVHVAQNDTAQNENSALGWKVQPVHQPDN